MFLRRSDTFLAVINMADIESSSSSSMCCAWFFGITNAFPFVTGNMSRNAYVSSSSCILLDLISPDIILQNKQSMFFIFVSILLSF